jgi:hypothetical protein
MKFAQLTQPSKFSLHGLRRKPRLRGLEQITIEDRHVVARMNLTSVFGFPAGAGTWGRIGSQRPTAWLA